MGDNVGALKMHNKALAICEKVYGKEHPYTIVSSNRVTAIMKKSIADME